MKKVLVILAQPIEDDTSSMLSARGLIEELAKNNDVVCVAPYGDRRSIYYNNSADHIDNTEIIRYGKSDGNNSSENIHVNTRKNKLLNILYITYKKFDVFGYSITYIKEFKKVIRNLDLRNFDILITFSDPKTTHIMGKIAKKANKNIYYIQHWGDPLAMDIASDSRLPLFVKKIIERYLLSSADRVFYVSPITLEAQKKIYPHMGSKFRFAATPGKIDMYLQHTKTEKITLAYCGSYISSVRNIMPIYNVALNDDRIELYIVGNGDVELDATENIHIIGRMNRIELKNIIEKSDILVSLFNNSGTQIPGKIYMDALTNKEILALVDGEYGQYIQDFFSQYNRYTFCKNNEESIRESVIRYLEQGIPDRKPLVDFEYANIAKDLLEK